MKKISTDFQTLIQKLSNALKQPLPGINAQLQMLPEGRIPSEPLKNYINAATLICLYPEKESISFPVIRRANHPHDRHSQQISLPGGKMENNESLFQTALRETNEEIGIPPENIEILSPLTPLPIPVSGFLMHPFVGYCRETPKFTIDPNEVQSLHLIDIIELLEKKNRRVKNWILGGHERKVPVFQIDTLRIWGATAMVLSEFAALLKAILIEADK